MKKFILILMCLLAPTFISLAKTGTHKDNVTLGKEYFNAIAKYSVAFEQAVKNEDYNEIRNIAAKASAVYEKSGILLKKLTGSQEAELNRYTRRMLEKTPGLEDKIYFLKRFIEEAERQLGK